MLCIGDLSWILNKDCINGYKFSSTFDVLMNALNQSYETVIEIGQLLEAHVCTQIHVQNTCTGMCMYTATCTDMYKRSTRVWLVCKDFDLLICWPSSYKYSDFLN